MHNNFMLSDIGKGNSFMQGSEESQDEKKAASTKGH